MDDIEARVKEIIAQYGGLSVVRTFGADGCLI
mgnify:CR=1 FL=1